MQTSIIVIDDFYGEPDKVRQRALELDYPEPETAPNFAGRNSVERIAPRGLEQAISKLVTEPVFGVRQFGHGRCRISLAPDDSSRRFYVHVDAGAYWAGVLYLTLPEHCQGGTEFYRHKRLGTDRAAIYAHEMAAIGAKTYREAAEPIIAADSADLTKWEHVMTVPMRYNRLILLRPWLWHAAGRSFGDSLANGRLVQLFFFGLGAAPGGPDQGASQSRSA
jgi:hypothetical protein